MFNLETGRLQIRSLTEADLPAVHAIFEHSFSDGSQVNNPQALAERASWLQWTILSDQWYAKLHQPPYGDKAIVLKSSQEVVGLVGFVPCLDRFEQLPIFQTNGVEGGFATPAVGLFWAVHPAHQWEYVGTRSLAKLRVPTAFYSEYTPSPTLGIGQVYQNIR